MKKFNLYEALTRPSNKLKRELRTAHMDIDPKKFIKRNFLISLQITLALNGILFFILLKYSGSLKLLLFTFPFLFLLLYFFFSNTPKAYIKRREKDISRNILFATRYLLVKIDSGEPLFNAMIKASNTYGVGGTYFKEIVDEINLGKSIEKAIEDAINYNTNHEFQLVLHQILNSLKTGVNITTSLRKLLEEITKQQQIEIKAYSKKLNSVVLMYLIVACVLPSLGISMFIIFSSMINIVLNFTTLLMIVFFIALIQLIFISIIKSIRPAVDI
ncbi:MAG: hypothetical protein MAG795_00940 [Candidatus Woesearchaeota archaeon]|nr:hypothetical protein [Candidatus Woesearchaeota archaeon]